jgi:hypothetical protein
MCEYRLPNRGENIVNGKSAHRLQSGGVQGAVGPPHPKPLRVQFFQRFFISAVALNRTVVTCVIY